MGKGKGWEERRKGKLVCKINEIYIKELIKKTM